MLYYYFLDTNPLPDMQFAHIFPHPIGRYGTCWLFPVLYWSFSHLMQTHTSFVLFGYDFSQMIGLDRKSLSRPMFGRFSFSSRICSFRSYLNLYLESILSGYNFILVDIEFTQQHLLKRFFFSHSVFSVYLQLVMHAHAFLFILLYSNTLYICLYVSIQLVNRKRNERTFAFLSFLLFWFLRIFGGIFLALTIFLSPLPQCSLSYRCRGYDVDVSIRA